MFRICRCKFDEIEKLRLQNLHTYGCSRKKKKQRKTIRIKRIIYISLKIVSTTIFQLKNILMDRSLKYVNEQHEFLTHTFFSDIMEFISAGVT